MNPQPDELQELWRQRNESDSTPSPRSTALPRRSPSGGSAAARMRRRIRRDGWLKFAILPVLVLALPLMTNRQGPAFWGTLALSLLAVLLGIFQVVWSSTWSEAEAGQPLYKGLTNTLELWRRRRPALVVLLGATPALAWQVYQLAYLAMNPASAEKLVNLLFLTAGGPILWVLAAWRQWARLEVWLLQIEQALGAFDEETALKCRIARKRSGRRLALIAALLLCLLIAGIVLFRIDN